MLCPRGPQSSWAGLPNPCFQPLWHSHLFARTFPVRAARVSLLAVHELLDVDLQAHFQPPELIWVLSFLLVLFLQGFLHRLWLLRCREFWQLRRVLHPSGSTKVVAWLRSGSFSFSLSSAQGSMFRSSSASASSMLRSSWMRPGLAVWTLFAYIVYSLTSK